MVFNVFFDPSVIDVAVKGEAFGLATLTSFLQGVLTNCLLFDFEDARGQTEIGQRMKGSASTFDLSVVKRLLTVIAKRNRIVFVIPVDYYSSAKDLDQALAVAGQLPLDLVLTENAPVVPVPGGTVIAGLAAYSGTTFEAERSDRAAHGMEFHGGEHAPAWFLDLTLGKALRHASKIVLCDRLLGQKFGDNFEHTIKQFFSWLERNLADPRHCVLHILCGRTDGRDHHFLHQLAALRNGRISGLPITVSFYDSVRNDCLPHQRYMQTDQFAFSIDRGMDFLDRATASNRDVSIGLKDEIEVARNLSAYSRFVVSTQSVS